MNEEIKEIAFFEVKWSDLQLGEARRILSELKEKLRGEGCLCYDLEDISKRNHEISRDYTRK